MTDLLLTTERATWKVDGADYKLCGESDYIARLKPGSNTIDVFIYTVAVKLSTSGFRYLTSTDIGYFGSFATVDEAAAAVTTELTRVGLLDPLAWASQCLAE